MLRDEGLQFTYLDYASVIQKGIPAEYKVLILPAALCLSDAEARQIKEFCKNGGTVIADYLPGLWDQHGKGRAAGGVLDDMFGVKHDPKMTAKDVFGETLWCETNQDANYGYKTYERADDQGQHLASRTPAASTRPSARWRVDQGQHLRQGQGRADEPLAAVVQRLPRRPASQPPPSARSSSSTSRPPASPPWVRIKDAGEKEFGYEITYWTKGGRTILFLISNAEVRGNSLGGGNAVGLKTEKLPVTLAFAGAVKDVKDERAGKELGDGKEFKVDWTQNEAVVLSFAGNRRARSRAASRRSARGKARLQAWPVATMARPRSYPILELHG